MRVCLVGAPTAHEFDDYPIGEAEARRAIAEHAPLGVLSLAAVLEQQGLRPEIVDLNRLYYDFRCKNEKNENDFSRFAASYFREREYDFVGFSSVCSSYPITLRVACEVKRQHPDSVVAFGGPQASATDVATLEAYASIDLVVRGEAEQTLPQLLEALAQGRKLDDIPGLTYRHDGKIARTPDGGGITDLDSLPFPAFHLLPDMEKCRFMPLELGRGCPFACTFCSTNDFFRRRFRLKSPEHVIAEMRRVKQTYGINSFELVHDMFTVDRKRVVAFCEALLACDEKFYWGSSARTDCIDEELIELMARAGCRGIFFGIESGSARLQKIIDKGLDLNDSAARIQYCDKFKINTAVSLIAGFPDETMDDLQDTAAFFMDSLRHDHADPQLSILSPLADTPIQKQHKASLVLDDDIADMSYRGWNQEHEDYEMIAAHPEIFSSFYSVPTPFVKREFLKEFRDFVLNGMRTFRWLFVGLHQDSGNIIKVFRHWQQWRAEGELHFHTPGSTVYYANSQFPADFLRFVQQHYIPVHSKAPAAITALLECESAAHGYRDEGANGRNGRYSDDDDELLPNSRLTLFPGVRLIKLNADFQDIIQRLRQKRPLNGTTEKSVTLAIRKNGSGTSEVHQLTPLSAELLALCQHNWTVEEMTAEFLQRKIEVSGIAPNLVCLAGIEMLRQQRFISLA